MRQFMIALLTGCFLSGCGSHNRAGEEAMNKIAEAYVKLVLKIGQYDSDYVDAYYGPESWKPQPQGDAGEFPAAKLGREAEKLLTVLGSIDRESFSRIENLRYDYLLRQLTAVKGRIDFLAGTRLDFDQESRLFYDAVAPHHDAAYFEGALEALNALLPGSGSVTDRLTAFKDKFIVPPDRLKDVFEAAIAECRKRTLAHISLPEGENFAVEYVTGKPWSAYNWYKGHSYSLIQVNTDLPIYVDRIIDLAAHEGYPGHHVYNALLEAELVEKLQWMEYSVYPLFSPQSLIAEGSANFGIEVAFPGTERVEFEKSVLFPLAGLDASQAEKYYRIFDLQRKLSYAGNEAARGLLDGTMTREQASDWLVKYGLMSPERAEQRVRFIEKYRSYVINYNVGEDMVRSYVNRNGGTIDQPQRRWDIFRDLLSTPRTPSGLAE